MKYQQLNYDNKQIEQKLERYNNIFGNENIAEKKEHIENSDFNSKEEDIIK